MLKRLTLSSLVLAILAAFALPLYAQQPFFNSRADNWIVIGLPSRGDKNAVCGAEYAFKDGSTFTLYSDLIDGELYLTVHNTRWSIGDKPGSKANLRMNFYDRSGNVNGGTAEFILIDKNTVVVPGLNPKVFIRDFVNKNKLELIMPGTIDNAEITLEGSSKAIDLLVQCVNSAGKQEPPKPKKKESDA